jgi:hypothetical protein
VKLAVFKKSKTIGRLVAHKRQKEKRKRDEKAKNTKDGDLAKHSSKVQARPLAQPSPALGRL